MNICIGLSIFLLGRLYLFFIYIILLIINLHRIELLFTINIKGNIELIKFFLYLKVIVMYMLSDSESSAN